jgi:hypothetical protein
MNNQGLVYSSEVNAVYGTWYWKPMSYPRGELAKVLALPIGRRQHIGILYGDAKNIAERKAFFWWKRWFRAIRGKSA